MRTEVTNAPVRNKLGAVKHVEGCRPVLAELNPAAILIVGRESGVGVRALRRKSWQCLSEAARVQLELCADHGPQKGLLLVRRSKP